MARIAYLDKKDLPPDQQKLLDKPVNITRAMVNSPKAHVALLGVGHHIRHHSKLDKRLREMAILQVGYTTREAYEWTHHLKIRGEFNVSDDDVRALMDDSAGKPTKLDKLTKAVLQAARVLTTDRVIPDDVFAVLKANFDAEEIIDLLVAIGYYNGLVRVMSALQIDVEDDYMPLLQQFPLPQ
jgi:alkylhydroperoxidase family enzyme